MSALQCLQFRMNSVFVEMITSMRGCVTSIDFLPWPLSSRSFEHEFPTKIATGFPCNPHFLEKSLMLIMGPWILKKSSHLSKAGWLMPDVIYFIDFATLLFGYSCFANLPPKFRNIVQHQWDMASWMLVNDKLLHICDIFYVHLHLEICHKYNDTCIMRLVLERSLKSH